MNNIRSPINLSTSFLKGLQSAALHPGLRGVLVFDASYDVLEVVASVLTQLLQAVTESEVRRIRLSTSEIDDDLWGSLAIENNKSKNTIVWHPGLLTANVYTPQTELIIIPDLTKISLAATRASVMLMGTDVANLERHGQQEQWSPQLCWLAACSKSEVGMLSPHLLDRFPLRLTWDAEPIDHSPNITIWLKQVLNDSQTEKVTQLPEYPLSQDLLEQVRRATRKQAPIIEKAITQVCMYSNQTDTFTIRREIALARFASSLARLEGATQTTEAHVDTAAYLIRLSSTTHKEEQSRSLDEQSQIQTAEIITPDETISAQLYGPLSQDTPSIKKKNTTQPENIYGSDAVQELERVMLSVDPYPEDKAPIEREIASLQMPLFRYSEAHGNHGVVVGVEQTRTLRDLAVVSTILAAAPFQRIRYERLSQHVQDGPKGTFVANKRRPFLLSRDDLRGYRRTPRAELLFVVLLDYTCLDGCEWIEALTPYISRAYIKRASVSITQVGVAGAAHEYRAENVSGHNILVPSIDAAFMAKRGKATPLAHGLDLVIQTLRHALQHGRSTVQQALLVLISDGRGNVPLEDSRVGRILQPVQRKGIDDALHIAQLIGELERVEKVLLNPQPRQYPDLPLLLADAMKAEVHTIRRTETVEVQR